MDKQRPSPRDMSHKGGQQSQSGQQAKPGQPGQAMPPGSGQMAPPPKGTQPTHSSNR